MYPMYHGETSKKRPTIIIYFYNTSSVPRFNKYTDIIFNMFCFDSYSSFFGHLRTSAS